MKPLIALTMAFLSAGLPALASFATPEIDGSTGPAAIALLSGGLLLLRTRRRKRTDSA